MNSAIRLLTLKSSRMIWRSPSMRILIAVSTSIVFGSLYMMWYMSYNQTLKFMTSNAYTKLSFDLICAPGLTYQPGISQCRPTGDNRPDGELSPADILINLLTTGSIMSDANDPNSAHDFAGLLSSIMMNGAPMLGLDDFVHLSDFVNKNLGSKGRSQIMNSTAYSDKFGNFLDVRKRELRITPYSCWTESFLSHLNKNSLIAKDLNIIQYPSMAEAMKDCCDNVWAIVEINAPSEGFDCGLFRDTGGTQYRTPNPAELYRNRTLNSSRSKEYTSFEDSDRNSEPRNGGYKSDTRSDSNKSPSEYSELMDPGPGEKVGKSDENGDEDSDSPILDVVELRAQMGLGPSVTVRMLPSAIPDTRNFEWSPRKSGSIRQQSGQLLYFLSGFLSIQLEVQNFLSLVGLGGPLIETKVFGDSPEANFFRPNKITKNIAEALIRSASNNEVYSAIINTTSEHREKRPALLTPLYHRAFPTHRYVQQTFWHVYGSMITTALVVFFSLPAAVTAGAFRREVAGGQLDSLSTLPGLRAVHSAAGWCLCGAIWCAFSSLVCYFFFLAVLNHTRAVVPAISLFLCGLSLGPLAIALGCVIKRADALVVTVPTFVFITMLPGLLYVDLAFDVQRSVWVEVLMCLLPPSGAALVLREVCGLEALNIAADWTYPAPISRTPIFVYSLVLLFDYFLYSVLAATLIAANHRTNTPKISESKRSTPHSADIGDATSSSQMYKHLFSWGLWTFNLIGTFFSAVGGLIYQGTGYFWGQQGHSSYASLSQEQRSYVDNYDVSYLNRAITMRGARRLPRRSTSAYDMRPHTQRPPSATFGSKSLGDLTMHAGRSRGFEPIPEEKINEEGESQESDGDEEEEGGYAGSVPTQTCLRILDLSKEYVTDRTGVAILHQVSAELRQGTVTCLLGSNGAGKTTLMRILCGLDSQYTGDVTLTEETPLGQGEEVEAKADDARPEGVNRRGRGEQRDERRPTSYQNSVSPLQVEPRTQRLPRNRLQTAPPPSPSPPPSSFFSLQWWREVALTRMSHSLRLYATVRGAVKRAMDYFLPPQSARVCVRRSVGWCAQEDALFDYLTVREHVELFDRLLGGLDRVHAPPAVGLGAEAASPSDSSLDTPTEQHPTQKDNYITRKCKTFLSYFMESESNKGARSAQTLFLSRLGIAEHSEKLAMELSGGMKRRLALALAFAGSPKVLLLDEPSSGCDSWTRELVRKDILLRKADTAILVSTHHIDDVEVLSDRVWFLNERYLEFDGPLDELTALGGVSALNTPTQSQDDITLMSLPVPTPVPTHTPTPDQPNTPHIDPHPDPPVTADTSMHADLQFSTWSESVMRTFREDFSPASADQWLMDSSLTCSSRSIVPETFSPIIEETLDRAHTNILDSKSKNFYIWRVPSEYSPQLHSMLVLLEGRTDAHWSVHSPNIYDALSAMYAPHVTLQAPPIPPLSVSPLPDTSTPPAPPPSSEAMLSRSDGPVTQVPPLSAVSNRNQRKESNRRSLRQSLLAASLLLHTVTRQCYHILKMRIREILTSLTQFVFTQIILPFLVVLGVVVGCRDISYPKVELSSKHIDGIGEVCVGLGPKSSPTRAHTPLSSPYDKVTANQYVNDSRGYTGTDPANPSYSQIPNALDGENPISRILNADIAAGSGLGVWKILLKLWKDIQSFFLLTSSLSDDESQYEYQEYGNSTDSTTNSSDLIVHKHTHHKRNQTYDDMKALKEYAGYKTLLALLGRKTLRWVGTMNSDLMFQNMYAEYYKHSSNRWASFILNDELEQWLESTVIIEQGSLNVSISSAFEEILRAERALCHGNTTSNNSSASVNGSGAVVKGRGYSSVQALGGVGYYTGIREVLGGDSVLSNAFEVPTQAEGGIEGGTGWQGRGLDMTVPDRVGIAHSKKDKNSREEEGSSDERHSPHASICGKHPAIRIYRRNHVKNGTAGSSGNSSSEDAIVVRSYEAMKANLSMLSNVTTDHAAPVFLKEIAPAVYSSLLPPSQRRKGGVYQSSSIPIYRLYSHPLPKINYTNQIYIERGYLGATMIVLYMLITTIVSVRAVTQMRKNGVKLQMHIAGVHPISYWCCNFIADSCIVQFSLLSVFLAVMLGGEPIRDYFLSSSSVDLPGGIFLECIFAFSFAVVASSYAFCALSSDQLSSQLLMLISTVAGGVFLKLYLDRHSGPFFGVLSSVFLWFSPCFTFATCMFDLFALRGAQMTLKFGAAVGSQMATSIAAVNRCIGIMVFQVVFYLTAAVIIDCYYARVVGVLSHIRFLLSLPLWSQAMEAKRIQDADRLVEMADFRSIRTSVLSTNMDPNPLSSFSFDTETPLTQSSHRGYSTDAGDQSQHPVQPNPDYPFTPTQPDVQSLFPGLVAGQGTRRVLKEHGTVYGEIGGFPGVREIEAGLRQVAERKRSGGRRHSCGVGSDGEGMPRGLDSYDIESSASLHPNPSMRDRGISTDTRQGTGTGSLVMAQDLFVEYSFGSKRKMALNGLSFEIKEGERVALLGMNGGGKSSLFKVLALAQNVPVDGTLEISGKNAVTQQWHISTQETMGYVAQEGGLVEFLTVQQTLDLFHGLHSIKQQHPSSSMCSDALKVVTSYMHGFLGCCGVGRGVGRSETAEVLGGIGSNTDADCSCENSHMTLINPDGAHTVPINEPHAAVPEPWGGVVGSSPNSILPSKYLNYLVHTLSGGNRKKLSVAISNINDPSFLAIDECTSGVDPLAAERIVRYLKDLKPSQGLLFASHRIDECVSTCNRVLMLVEGTVYFDGSVHAFDQLASLFYQVDLVLPQAGPPVFSPFSSFASMPTHRSASVEEANWLQQQHRGIQPANTAHTADTANVRATHFGPSAPSPSPSEQVISKIGLLCGGLHLFERVVEYSPVLIRLTFEKRLVPLTRVWSVLGGLRREGLVERYSFRAMGMEEALATIIESSKGI